MTEIRGERKETSEEQKRKPWAEHRTYSSRPGSYDSHLNVTP